MKKNIDDVDVKKIRAAKMAATPKRVWNNTTLLLYMNKCLKIYEKYILDYCWSYHLSESVNQTLFKILTFNGALITLIYYM